MQRLSVVIPCCNEEGNLVLFPERLFPVLSQLARTGGLEVELILVDDGSRDGTWEQLNALANMDAPFTVRLARHPTNQGLGRALTTGTQLARGDIIATNDADGTYPFEILLPLVDAIQRGADVATASQYHPDGAVLGVTPLRLLLSRGASLLYRIVVDRNIYTYTSLARAYRAPTLKAVTPSDAGFLYVAKLLVEARRRRARIVEIPATLASRQLGSSKARLVQITRTHLRYMGRLAWLRLTGRFWLPPVTRAVGVTDELALET